MWSDSSLERKSVIPMTPFAGSEGDPERSARAGALTHYNSAWKDGKPRPNKLLTSKGKAIVRPPALVPCGVHSDEFEHDLVSYHLIVHVGCDTRREFDSRTGPRVVSRFIGLMVTEAGTLVISHEPPWEVMVLDQEEDLTPSHDQSGEKSALSCEKSRGT